MNYTDVLNAKHIFTYEPIDGKFTYKATLDRTTPNKRDVMREICNHAENYTTEENLEFDFDSIKENYKYVFSYGSDLDLDYCICGHNIHEICVVRHTPFVKTGLSYTNTINDHKGELADLESFGLEMLADGSIHQLANDNSKGLFYIGNDCIRLFSDETINLSQWVNNIVRGTVQQIPKWYQGMHTVSPFDCIQSIHSYTHRFTIRDRYKRFGLVFNTKLGVYIIVAIDGNDSVYSITKDKKLNIPISVVKNINKHINKYPIVSASMEAINEVFSTLDLPRVDSLKLEFGKYEGSYLNHLVVKDINYCRWLLDNVPLETGQESYLKLTLLKD